MYICTNQIFLTELIKTIFRKFPIMYFVKNFYQRKRKNILKLWMRVFFFIMILQAYGGVEEHGHLHYDTPQWESVARCETESSGDTSSTTMT